MAGRGPRTRLEAAARSASPGGETENALSVSPIRSVVAERGLGPNHVVKPVFHTHSEEGRVHVSLVQIGVRVVLALHSLLRIPVVIEGNVGLLRSIQNI